MNQSRPDPLIPNYSTPGVNRYSCRECVEADVKSKRTITILEWIIVGAVLDPRVGLYDIICCHNRYIVVLEGILENNR